MHGLQGEDGRWIQDDGEWDIECMREPVVILEHPDAVVTLAFFTNNEPHLNFTAVKSKSIGVMKFMKTALKQLLVKFDQLGYDKVFILVAEDDLATIKKTEWLGFKPRLIYDSPFGLRYVKYEMETT